jgi:hypothetical protein
MCFYRMCKLACLSSLVGRRWLLYSHKLVTIRVHSCAIFAALTKAYADCFTNSGGGFEGN